MGIWRQDGRCVEIVWWLIESCLAAGVTLPGGSTSWET